ncbi:MAG: PorT family protein [Bacteroidota bacterium]
MMKNLFFSVSFTLFTLTSFAQYQQRDGNRIGITIGLSQSTLTTSNFKTKSGMGWNAGLSVRGNYYNNWSMIYGMQFFENNFKIQTNQGADVNYSLSGAQVRLLLSYNVVKDHVSIDFGPVLQINGDMKIDSREENYIISGTALRANQILEVNQFNGNIYGGISAGNRRLRAIIFYQYGFTNMLKSLDSQDGLMALNGNRNFKGNMGTISGQILFNL